MRVNSPRNSEYLMQIQLAGTKCLFNPELQPENHRFRRTPLPMIYTLTRCVILLSEGEKKKYQNSICLVRPVLQISHSLYSSDSSTCYCFPGLFDDLIRRRRQRAATHTCMYDAGTYPSSGRISSRILWKNGGFPPFQSITWSFMRVLCEF